MDSEDVVIDLAQTALLPNPAESNSNINKTEENKTQEEIEKRVSSNTKNDDLTTKELVDSQENEEESEVVLDENVINDVNNKDKLVINETKKEIREETEATYAISSSSEVSTIDDEGNFFLIILVS